MHFFEEKLHLRLGQFFGVCVGCLSFAVYVIKIEKRAVFELALKGAWQAYGAGFTVGGLMMSERSGPDWLTGGAFGIEGHRLGFSGVGQRRDAGIGPAPGSHGAAVLEALFF